MSFNFSSLTVEKMLEVLDYIYGKALTGLPSQKNIYDLAEEYRANSSSTEEAISRLIKFQVAKATATGAATGLGGLITLPVTLSADVVGCLAIQLRMIGAIAVLRGYEPSDDQVKTFVYVCLVGTGALNILKDLGIRVGVKLSGKLLNKISGQIFIKINQKVGYRLVTKNGSKGLVNLGKTAPFIGAPIGGIFNYLETHAIAKVAKKILV